MNGAGTQVVTTLRALRLPSPTLVLYVLRELIVPTLMGFGVFTFFLLMSFLLEAADMIIKNDVGAADVGRLFLLNLPHIVVLTVPMAVLVGGLLAFGRMSADSEIIAMRSGGISVYQISVPILLLASVATIVNMYLCLVILPWGNNEIIQLQWRLVNTRTLSNEIRPRVFETGFPNYMLYMDDRVGPDRDWQDLLLVKTDVQPHRVVMAEAAATQYDQESGEIWLELNNGHIYEGGDTAEVSSVTRFTREVELLMTREGTGEVGEVSKTERMQNLPELRQTIAAREAANLDTAKWRIEVHKKFSIPIACLVMGLIALPLGVSTSRHTKATGFLTSIGVIAVYYALIDNGEKLAQEGVIPVWLGMWGANIAIGLAAFFLLWAKAREKDFGIADAAMRLLDEVLVYVNAGWRQLRRKAAGLDVPGVRIAGAQGTTANGGRRFPRILDRYVMSQFVRVFAMAFGALVLIFVLGDYFEISDDVYAVGASRWLLYEYLKFHLPFIAMYAVPIATVVTVLTVFSLMSKNSEVVAVLAGGTSLFRLAAPMLIPAVALTVVEYAISDYVVPHTDARASEIRQSLREPDPSAFAATQGMMVGGQWLRGQGRYLFNYLDYDPERQAFQGLYIYYLDPEIWRLGRVEYFDHAEWDGEQWMARDAWRRPYRYDDDGASSLPLERQPTAVLRISEQPEYFGTERRLPAQMSAAELRQHIADLEQRGFDASKYAIDLQQKLAFPAVVFVLAVVGIPFGFRMGRQGAMSGIAVGLALSAVFWLVFVLFQALGSAEILPAVVAAWAPHALFLALAGYITLGLRT